MFSVMHAIACMTENIYFLVAHLKKSPNDIPTVRYLAKLIHRRRTMLDYLRKSDFHYYKWVIAEYNIPDKAPLNAHHTENFRGPRMHVSHYNNKQRKMLVLFLCLESEFQDVFSSSFFDVALAHLLLSLDPPVVCTCCLLYTSPSPRDGLLSRMPSSA
eukprot:TRINITY_DN1090_c0_g1_i9.p3 TRINITY_DN1090_c0_g1~~TRINITY_DN1090_c0_g1_i9.p3  ORF type:complete len:158 (+),score=27.72 TRINITY_DN1090_c0_g1_i9:552-1025(+)